MNVSRIGAVARSGYAARGVVYLIVGGLALTAALGAGGGATGSKGALSSLNDVWFGEGLIAALGMGLLAYALWRGVQAVMDADNHGTDPKGLVIRGGLLVSALTHLVLAYYALSLLFGWAGSGSGSSRDLAGWLMSQTYGRYLVGAVGLTIIGAGCAQAWKGLSGGYEKRLSVPESKRRGVFPICTLGLVARGIVFCIIGSLFIYAAVRVDPSHAGGTREALHLLQAQPYGSVLFLCAAVGLVMFGLYSIAEALWRRVSVEEEPA